MAVEEPAVLARSVVIRGADGTVIGWDKSAAMSEEEFLAATLAMSRRGVMGQSILPAGFASWRAARSPRADFMILKARSRNAPAVIRASQAASIVFAVTEELPHDATAEQITSAVRVAILNKTISLPPVTPLDEINQLLGLAGCPQIEVIGGK